MLDAFWFWLARPFAEAAFVLGLAGVVLTFVFVVSAIDHLRVRIRRWRRERGKAARST